MSKILPVEWINPTDQRDDTLILMSTFSRIGLSFGSLFLSVMLFCLFFTGLFRAESFLPVVILTTLFTLPAWCQIEPFVIALKDAETRRFRTILY